MAIPIPATEAARLEALRRYRIMDTEAEAAYDDLTRVASHVCGTPIALVSLLDENRQWFKARVGVAAAETPRSMAFCAYAIMGRETFVVPDAAADPRFAANPLVTGDPHIRFYAGAPLVTADGHGLGTLCVIDRRPRDLEEGQLAALQSLARQVVTLLEYRAVTAELAAALTNVKQLKALLPMCAWCKGVRDDDGYWSVLEAYLCEHAGARTTHGICPACLGNQLDGLTQST